MSEKRAAGLVIFRKVAGEIQYLLLQTTSATHHWTPPKGHQYPRESDMETALRETQEESGLMSKDFSVLEDSRIESKYQAKGKPKTVIYWLAELHKPDTPVVLSHEHQDYKWLPISEACALAAYPAMITVLQECDEYLKKKSAL